MKKIEPDVLEIIMDALNKATDHGILPVPNPYGNTLTVERHNRVVEEMRRVFLESIHSQIIKE